MSRGRQHLLGVGLDPGLLQDLGQGQRPRRLVFELLENQVLASEGIDGGKLTSTFSMHLESQ